MNIINRNNRRRADCYNRFVNAGFRAESTVIAKQANRRLNIMYAGTFHFTCCVTKE
jgi:hypothetical protein